MQLILRPYRRLKAFGGLAASAHPTREATRHTTKLGDESLLVRDLMHGQDAQLCYVELVGPGVVGDFERARGRTVRNGQTSKIVHVDTVQVDGPDGVA